MEQKTKLADAYPLAQQILEAIAPYCNKAEIAGSIRRRKPQVGDIEIVAEALRFRGESPVSLGSEPITDELDFPLRLLFLAAFLIGG